ncbi:MAG TPA: BadF/BadG/BcrA/BcrD ATPase family protein [Pirellulaceae bacterium]|nr:BadF/BadG/BcrA/BcrD ATPase family protein [Pirellulaceae bacterium]
MAEHQEFVIGVDGGGTKTAAWLASLVDDTILGRGQAGPGNPRAAGFEVAQANIAAAVAAAFDDAKLSRQAVAAACFGLAGAGREVEQQLIADWALGRRIAKKVRVCGDAELILAAASPENCGVALIAGTGSLAWGRNQAGETTRCGGWGYLLGDEGSGYAIALAGLRAAMRAADGRGPTTGLLPAFLRELGAATAPELIGKVYSPEMTRERLAGLASVVFEYRSTDEVAQRIVADAAGELAAMVTTVATELKLPPQGYMLAISGGVLLNQLNYLEQFLFTLWAHTHSGESQPARCVKVEEPVRGAVALARLLAR